MSDLFQWTNLFPRNTGLPVTIWISVNGIVATDPYNPEQVEHASAVASWIELNRDALLEHWTGNIDGGDMAARTKRI